MKHLTLKDIIFIMSIALIFGALFVGTDVIYAPLYLVIGPFANEVLFGLWIMAGPLAIAILRLPGTAVIRGNLWRRYLDLRAGARGRE